MTVIRRFGLAAIAFSALAYPASAQEAAPAEGAAAAGAAGAPAAGAESSAPTTYRDEAALQAFNTGRQLLGEKKYKEAIAELNKAIAIDSTYFEALILKGDALRELQDYGNAISAYSAAINYTQRSVEAFNGRGECFMEVQQIDLAKNDFDSALEIDPNNPRVLANEGHILVNYSRDPVSALRRLDDAIALNDKDARAFRDRGYAHVLLREYDKAAADLQKAVEVDPTDYENYSTLASGLLLQDMYAPAIDALTKAIETYKPKKTGEPEKFISGYLSRADARLKIAEKETDAATVQAALDGVIADADAVLALYADRFPDGGRAHFRKGRALRMLQRYADAIDSFTDSITSVPPGQDVEYIADAMMYRGICWFYLGENELARGDFEQASATGSGYQDPRVFLWIGFTQHKQGNYRDAITSYNQAIAKAPQFALAYINKGRAYMDLGEFRKAIDCFNDAVRAEPDNGEHYYNTGFAYMKLNEPQRTVFFLEIALAKKDPQPKMYGLMATALRKLGRNELADQYQRKAEAAPQTQASGQ
jgi:tetratricopeptide (TPR) repeat protein